MKPTLTMNFLNAIDKNLTDAIERSQIYWINMARENICKLKRQLEPSLGTEEDLEGYPDTEEYRDVCEEAKRTVCLTPDAKNIYIRKQGEWDDIDRLRGLLQEWADQGNLSPRRFTKLLERTRAELRS